MKQSELHKLLIKFGDIISLKLCFSGDHVSKGFGYVTFDTEKAAQAAIEAGALVDDDKVVAHPYSVPSAVDQNSLVKSSEDSELVQNGSNLYIKFIPDDWTEEILRQKFEVFGVIKSMQLNRN